MDFVTAGEIRTLKTSLHNVVARAAQTSGGGVERLMGIVTLFPAYLVAGTEKQARMELAALTETGAFLAATIEVTGGVSMKLAEGDIVDVADPSFNAPLALMRAEFLDLEIERRFAA